MARGKEYKSKSEMNLFQVDACNIANEIGIAIERLQQVAKPITPQSKTGVSEEDIDPEQAQRDKESEMNLARLAKYFKKHYKPPTTTFELLQTPEQD
ncbi:hypothetical protein Tco_0736151 [Tanacetum coccineum]